MKLSKLQGVGIALILFAIFCVVAQVGHVADFFILGLVSAIIGIVLCIAGCFVLKKDEDKDKDPKKNQDLTKEK